MEKTIGYSLEPWSFGSNSSFVDICDSMGRFIADTGASSCTGDADLGIGNARRIVACVNACKHYTTEDLEDVGENLSGVYADVKVRCAELIAQRDELLAAIEVYLPYMPNSTAKNGGACGHSEMLKASDRIKDAFAKCEVQS